MVHGYQYSFINMDQALRPKMDNYIYWSLENEHGNVGFSGTHTHDIPLSKFGMQLKTVRGMNRVRYIANHIKENADGNIAMARLRLDVVNRLSDLDLIEAQLGTPPPDVIALLDAAFEATQNQCVSSSQGELALKVLAIVSQFPYLEGPRSGVPFETLSTLLQQSESRSCNPTVYTEEEILVATEGLVILPSAEGKPVMAYNKALHTYLREEGSQPASIAQTLKALEGILSPVTREFMVDDE